MKNKYFLFASLLIAALFTSACFLTNIVTADEAIATEVEKALGEIMEQTSAAEAAATYTPYPTYTPAPTYTPQGYLTGPFWNQYIPSDTGDSRMTGYCNDAYFKEETIADNTIFNPGDYFTKTWTLKNTGQCTWTTDYKLVFVSGNSMSGDTSSSIPYEVLPGGYIVLSVDLKAPSSEGTYLGYWALQSKNGSRFANFWVQIKVRD